MFNNFLYRVFIVAVVQLSASNAMSQDISFDYVQATYTFATVDLGASLDEIEGNGIGLSLSLSFTPHFALILGVLDTTFESYQGMDVDGAKATTLGLITHTPIASGGELFARLAALKAEVAATDDTGSTGNDDFGYASGIGLRQYVTDKIELELGFSHVYVFNTVDNSFKANARYYLRKRVSIGIGYLTGDSVNSFSLNFRLDV